MGAGFRPIEGTVLISLRSRILTLYVALAVVPMLVVGLGNYVQSVRSLSGLVNAKLESASDQGVVDISARLREARSTLRLLAESGFIERLDESPPTGAAGDRDLARGDARSMLGGAFESVEIRDAAGRTVREARPPPVAAGPETCTDPGERTVAVVVPLAPATDGTPRGEIEGRVRTQALLSPEALSGWFGRNGQRLVVDRRTGGVLFDARCVAGRAPERSDAGAWVWEDRQSGRGTVAFTEDGIEKSGSWVALRDLPWVVITAADFQEFTGPYGRAQLLYLGLVMLVVIAAGSAFLILAQRVMRSLEELTEAAGRIGDGDLMPTLPAEGKDEVGRLSRAFGVMVARLKAMIHQNEATRRLAVAGEVAAQLSHEIRNPLSSIRLNLQSLARETGSGTPPPDLPRVLHLCLREIERLDEAVSSVLDLGQPRPPEILPCRLGEIVDDALDVVRPRFRARHITIDWDDHADCDWISGDPGQLKGVFINLLLNAVEAMPSGGTLRLWSESDTPDGGPGEVHLHVRDSGPGIAPEVRQLIFEPFFTSKAGGSGIGLAVARQTAEVHGGRLELAPDMLGTGGAEFILTLPADPALENAAEEQDGPAGPGVTPRRSGSLRRPLEQHAEGTDV
jgi:signal transduction histidine kinase